MQTLKSNWKLFYNITQTKTKQKEFLLSTLEFTGGSVMQLLRDFHVFLEICHATVINRHATSSRLS